MAEKARPRPVARAQATQVRPHSTRWQSIPPLVVKEGPAVYCCKCGAPIFEHARYCSGCGSLVYRCHACGAEDGLQSWDFGLGKVISKNWHWGETFGSAVLSALAVPVVGLGLLRFPHKSTRLAVLRLKLTLCAGCSQDGVDFSLHPSWVGAHELGFSEFIGPNDLARLEPA
jgi:hypothetical protein